MCVYPAHTKALTVMLNKIFAIVGVYADKATSYIECYTSNLAEFFNSLAVVLFERGKSLNQTNAGAFVYSRLGMTVLRFNEG